MDRRQPPLTWTYDFQTLLFYSSAWKKPSLKGVCTALICLLHKDCPDAELADSLSLVV